MGKKVKEFEEKFASKIGSTYCVMFNSGSSANLALISALRYKKSPIINVGDEIIVPSVSWSTTFYPVSQLGAKLRFVDICKDTLNICPNQIEAVINGKTKAIFVVNLLGNPSDLNAILEIAKRHNLVVIEDNCESLGAKFEGKDAGTFGLAGTFSFFFSHHISTMEGGMVATDDLELYETLLSIRAHGWTRELPSENSVHPKVGDEWDDLYRFVLPGYNLRPLELEAAIGLVQIEKLKSFIEERRKNAKYFLEKMSSLESYNFQKENGQSSWFGFSILLKGNLIGKRKKLIRKLSENLIESRPIVAGDFTSNPVLQHLEHAPFGEMPNAKEIGSEGFFVGNHHFPIRTQIDHLFDILKKFEEDNGVV